MTTTNPAAAFAVPPQGTFPILVGGVPAMIGPWMFRITCDRRLINLPLHQLSVIAVPMPAGSFQLKVTWTYVDGQQNTQIHTSTAMVPRPQDGDHQGKALLYQARHDSHGTWYSRTGKQRRGLSYFLTVTHVYHPHADQTIDGLWERHLTNVTDIDATLGEAQRAINTAREKLRKPPS